METSQTTRRNGYFIGHFCAFSKFFYLFQQKWPSFGTIELFGSRTTLTKDLVISVIELFCSTTMAFVAN